jgi:hypothetical protein
MEDMCRHSPSRKLHHPSVEEDFIQNMKKSPSWGNEPRKWRKEKVGNENTAAA